MPLEKEKSRKLQAYDFSNFYKCKPRKKNITCIYFILLDSIICVFKKENEEDKKGEEKEKGWVRDFYIKEDIFVYENSSKEKCE